MPGKSHTPTRPAPPHGNPPEDEVGAQDVLVIEKPFLTRPHLFLRDEDTPANLPLPIYQQINLLREALRPFAEWAELIRSRDGEKPAFSMNLAADRRCELTVNDFRRARIALTLTEG